MHRPLVRAAVIVVIGFSLVWVTSCDHPTAPALQISSLVVSGDGQQGVVGTTLANPLVIKATDSKGRPVRNQPVTFRVTSGGGSVSPGTVNTNSQGIAQASWTVGTSTAQTQVVEARGVSTNDLYGTFTATPLPGPVAQLGAQAGDSQTAPHDATVAIAPAVFVRDQYGNPVAGSSVTFTVNGGGGSVTGSPATANASGIATVGSWRLGHAPGANTLRATSGSASPFTFTATATPGAAAHLAIYAGNNQTAVVYTTLPIAPAVRITDADGNAVPGVVVKFLVISGGSYIVPDTGSTNSSGVATTLGWVLHWIAGTTTLRATAPGVMDTVLFTATGVHGPIDSVHTVVTVPVLPITASTGSSSATITAYVSDAFNNRIAGATVVFAVSGTGNTIRQPSGPTNADGIATGAFSTTQAGLKTVSTTADGVALRPATVTVNATFPRSVAAFAGDSQSGITGTQLPINPTFIVRDEFGNPTPGAFLSMYVYGGGTIGSPSRNADANGLVSTIWVLGPNPGNQLISAGSTQVGYAFIHATAITPAASIEIVQGDGQSATAGTAVPVPPRVLVRNAAGDATSNAFVQFSVIKGDGAFAAPYPYHTWDAQRTGPDGLASVASWTLGPYFGTNTLEARVVGTEVAVTFTATGTGSSWTRLTDLPTRRFYLGAAELGGRVYAIGGLDSTTLPTLETYDPLTDSWSLRAPMPTPRYAAGVATINGLLYVVGGAVDRDLLGTLEVYDPVTDQWTTRASMPTPRAVLGVAVVDGILYAIGGAACVSPGPSCTTHSVATVEAYDPATDTWSTKAPMPTNRQSLATATANGRLYAAGGLQTDPFVDYLNTVEEYDPSTDTWIGKAPMPTARYGLVLVPLNGALHAIGGLGAPSHSSLGTHEEFDPVANIWTTRQAMPTPRSASGAAAVNGMILVIGGNRVPGENFVEAYRP